MPNRMINPQQFMYDVQTILGGFPTSMQGVDMANLAATAKHSSQDRASPRVLGSAMSRSAEHSKRGVFCIWTSSAN